MLIRMINSIIKLIERKQYGNRKESVSPVADRHVEGT